MYRCAQCATVIAGHWRNVHPLKQTGTKDFAVQYGILKNAASEAQIVCMGLSAEILKQMKNDALGRGLQCSGEIEVHLLESSVRHILFKAKNAAKHHFAVSRLKNHGSAIGAVTTFRK